MKNFRKTMDEMFLKTYELNVGDEFKLVKKNNPNDFLVLKIVNCGKYIGFVVEHATADLGVRAHGLDTINLPILFDGYFVESLKKVPIMLKKCYDDCKDCPFKSLCVHFNVKKIGYETVFENFKATEELYKEQGRYDYTLFSVLKSRLEQEVWEEKKRL